MKHKVYFLRWGITTEISLISSRTGSLLLAGTVPLGVPFAAGRDAIPSSKRRFLDTGSEDVTVRFETWSEIWLNNSI